MKHKIIHLIRHAKSDWNYPGLRDHDRPLNPRGRKNAPDMAQRLLTRYGRVDAVLCSDAKRTQETMSFFRDAGCFTNDSIQLHSALYHAHHSVLEQTIQTLSNEIESVIVFGHNPGISELTSIWSQSSMHMPTCSIASFEFFGDDWQLLSPQTVRLIHFDYPKNTYA